MSVIPIALYFDDDSTGADQEAFGCVRREVIAGQVIQHVRREGLGRAMRQDAGDQEEQLLAWKRGKMTLGSMTPLSTLSKGG